MERRLKEQRGGWLGSWISRRMCVEVRVRRRAEVPSLTCCGIALPAPPPPRSLGQPPAAEGRIYSPRPARRAALPAGATASPTGARGRAATRGGLPSRPAASHGSQAFAVATPRLPRVPQYERDPGERPPACPPPGRAALPGRDSDLRCRSQRSVGSSGRLRPAALLSETLPFGKIVHTVQ